MYLKEKKVTSMEYDTLIFPVNLFHSVEEFHEFIKIKEEGWREGMNRILQACEEKELYEYCAVIKQELDKETTEESLND